MMLSTILWGSIIVGGTIVYGAMNGGYQETTKSQSSSNKINKDETYDYITKLSYDEIDNYINDNYKLSEYKGYIESNCNMGDKRQIARAISNIAEKENRNFTNRFSRY